MGRTINNEVSKDDSVNSNLSRSIWLVYTIIVFEILFMVSPFGLYYYSAYAVPLNWLADSQLAWLVQHILPHFTYHSSSIGTLLINISWPLILVGLVLFILGFVQIYWAKFTGKGAVAVGLYKYIRHPQYVALALIGLGTTIYWSRFVILISYMTMLFIYYLLAKHEERICEQKFGDSYRDYMSKTGRFFPTQLSFNIKLPFSISHLPALSRTAIWLVMYCVLVSSTVLAGWQLKRHVIDQLQTRTHDNWVLLALAPTRRMDFFNDVVHENKEIQAMLDKYPEGNKVVYLAPSGWKIPELGLLAKDKRVVSSNDELMYPTIHGNSLDFDRTRWRLLFTHAKGQIDSGDEILLNTVAVEPIFEVFFEDDEIVFVNDSPNQSYWHGIPVPIY